MKTMITDNGIPYHVLYRLAEEVHNGIDDDELRTICAEEGRKYNEHPMKLYWKVSALYTKEFARR